MRRRNACLGLLLTAGAVLFGCGGRATEIYRYRLTLEVETPDGIRRASNVVGIFVSEHVFPEHSELIAVRGEALFLDLAPCPRPLVALLTSEVRDTDSPGGPTQHWGDLSPGIVIDRAFGRDPDWPAILKQLHQKAGSIHYPSYRLLVGRGPREIGPGDLPDLVTFADVNDPMSVEAVDPTDLEASLCPGVRWHKLTLELTDDPVTRGLDRHLPWLTGITAYLNGRSSSSAGPLANRTGKMEFIQGIKPWP